MRRTLNLLGVSVLALLAIGFILLASVGVKNGMSLLRSAHHFVYQGVWLVAVATPVMLFMAFFDYHRWRRTSWLTLGAYIAVAALLVLVLLLGKKINGSQRWLEITSSIRLQPSELAKLTTVIALGVFIDKIGWRIELFWKGAFASVLLFGVFAALIIKEPDYGSTMVVCLTGMAVLLVAGMKLWHFAVIGGIGLIGVLTKLSTDANRMRRIVAWLPDNMAGKLVQMLDLPDVGMDKKAENAAYQLKQAIVAIQNGGYTGVGFNKSMQKEAYLPEAHTDFIFAIGAEEWGLVFSLLLLALFTIVFICGMRISARAPDRLGRLFAFGATFLIFFQAMFNIGVVTGALPTKGLALPFISYGGTNLVTAMAAIGLLFNVGRQIETRNPNTSRHRAPPPLRI